MQIGDTYSVSEAKRYCCVVDPKTTKHCSANKHCCSQLAVKMSKIHRTRYGVYLVIIKGLFSLVLHTNICCGYSLESPQHGNSSEYP